MSQPWTRRELLNAFLGGAVVVSGCRETPVPALPPGELLGPPAEFGHVLRDRRMQFKGPTDWTETDVLIVGGGIAGLSAARRLTQAGVQDLQLVELDRQLGGTSQSGSSAVSQFPWGAHYLPVPLSTNGPLIDLLQEMDLLEGRGPDGAPIVREQFLCRDPQERLFYKGNWYEGLYLSAGATQADLDDWQRFEAAIHDWVGWRDADGRRAFVIPMQTGSDAEAVRTLDSMSMAEWLDQRKLNSSRLRWYVDYACRDDYGLRSEQTSAWAGLFYFAARIADRGDEPQPFITWPEGNGRIVQHLAQFVAGKSQTGWAAVRIDPQPAGSPNRIEVTLLSREAARLRGVRAKAVVFAAPQFLAPYLIKDLPEERAAAAREFRYGSWAVANLHLTDRPAGRGFPLCWDNVLYESPSVGYVVATHQSCQDYGPTVLTYYYPLCEEDEQVSRQKLLSADREHWAEIALSDLERAHPQIRRLCERIDVLRWGHAMIQPRPGFLWGTARRSASEPFHGIHFAHCDLSGLALMEESFDRGLRAAEAILSDIDSTIDA